MPDGLRDRKKAQTRERLADVAAALFAEHGYDAVSIADVARSADVSDQTVYNYFPAKHDLVLDRAEEIRLRYDRLVRERAADVSPAQVVQRLVHEDVARLRSEPPALARGEFAALCLRSPVLRRYALEFRERQTETVAAAVLATTPGVDPLVAHAHAAALVAVVQWVTDQIGTAVLDDRPADAAARATRRSADTALDDLDRHFRSLVGSQP